LDQRRNLLPIGFRGLPGFAEGKASDGADAGNVRVVVNHDAAVPGGVDVQLNTVRVEHDRSPEGGSGIFVFVAGSAAMGDHTRAWHGQEYSRESRVASDRKCGPMERERILSLPTPDSRLSTRDS